MSRQIALIDLNEARHIVDAGLARAAAIAVPVFIIVVDAHGQTVAAARADGANFFSERIARGKALTAVGMGAATAVWEDATAANPGFGGGITSVADFTPFAGGVPLRTGNELLGAVGISGGTPAQDIDIADAAAAALA